jgi:hypothetical protein
MERIPPGLEGTEDKYFQKDIEVLLEWVYLIIPINTTLIQAIRALQKINDVIREHQQSTNFSKLVRAEGDASLLQSLKEAFANATSHFSVSCPVYQPPTWLLIRRSADSDRLAAPCASSQGRRSAIFVSNP